VSDNDINGCQKSRRCFDDDDQARKQSNNANTIRLL